jgi:hypothetical protein
MSCSIGSALDRIQAAAESDAVSMPVIRHGEKLGCIFDNLREAVSYIVTAHLSKACIAMLRTPSHR